MPTISLPRRRAWISAALLASSFATVLGQGPSWPVLGVLDAPPNPQGLAAPNAVDGSADLDGDGTRDLVVASLGADALGRVDVYSGATGALLRSLVGTVAGERFGWKVLVPGDLSGDGVPDIVVSAVAPGAGRVIAYSGATGAPIGMILPPPQVASAFGRALAATPDFDGDGIVDIVVGSPANCPVSETPSGCIGFGPVAGRAYVYSGGSGLLLLTLLPPAGANWASSYGASVLGPGDLSGDGVPDFVVAGTEGNHNQPAAIQLHSGASGLPILTVFTPNTPGIPALASPGDANGDAVPDIAIAAQTYNAVTGVANQTTLVSGATGLPLWTSAAALGTGSAVASIGDVNGDGIGDLASGGGTPAGYGFVNGRALALSGANGAVLSTFQGSFGEADTGFDLAGMGDLDGDMLPDYATIARGPEGGRAYFVSAAAGTAIRAIHSSSARNAFGLALANVGDVDGDGLADLVVGAPLENGGGNPDSGVVRAISTRTGAVVRTYLTGVIGANLGASLAGLGDLDGDGAPDFAAGAPHFPVAAYGAVPATPNGTVQVFSGASTAVIHAQSGVSPTEMYGFALAAVPDVDGDGKREIAIGVPGAAVGALAKAGRVEVRSGLTGALLATFSGGAANDGFGSSLADIGDVDGDGVSDLAIGAPQAPLFEVEGVASLVLPFPGAGPTGYVQIRSGATGALVSTLSGSIGLSSFGRSVGRVGDVDADGVADLVVGAPWAHGTNTGILRGGRAELRSGASGAVLQTVIAPQGGQYVGYNVGPAGDVDGDGVPDFTVAAPGASLPNQSGRGSVTIHSGATAAPVSAWWGATAAPVLAYFGRSLAQLDDMDGDGRREIAAGAPMAPDTTGTDGRGFVQILAPKPAPGPAPISAGCSLYLGQWSYAPNLEVVGIPTVTSGNPLFGVILTGLQQRVPLYLAVGTSTTSWGTTPLPLALGPFGFTGCTLDVSADAIVPSNASSYGWRHERIPLPVAPSLAGFTVYFQALMIAIPGSSSVGAMTPAVAVVLQ